MKVDKEKKVAWSLFYKFTLQNNNLIPIVLIAEQNKTSQIFKLVSTSLPDALGMWKDTHL